MEKAKERDLADQANAVRVYQRRHLVRGMAVKDQGRVEKERLCIPKGLEVVLVQLPIAATHPQHKVVVLRQPLPCLGQQIIGVRWVT